MTDVVLELDNSSTLTERVCYYARISNREKGVEDAERLVKYLIRNKHWSPFEMVDLTFYIHTTRDIARQMLRHRSFSFQEFSQRYSDSVVMSTPKEARLQDKTNRQSSLPNEDPYTRARWEGLQNQVKKASEEAYKTALSMGIAKEVARVVLPEGLTYSEMYMKGSLRSWIHYLQVRLDPTTQKEHREVAQLIYNEVETVFPLIREIIKDED